jgi:tellurite resistance protein
MTLSRMSITLPAELLDAVSKRANRDNITRSALTINALTAYLEGRIIEPEKQDNMEVIRLRTKLKGKDEIIRRADETIDALRLALDIRNTKSDPREIEGEKQNSDLKTRSLQFLEANNNAEYSISKNKRPSRDLNPSRSLDRARGH